MADMYLINVPSGKTNVTAATVDENCEVADVRHTWDTNFGKMVQDWSFDGRQITFTVKESASIDSESGISTVNYSVNGISCEKKTLLVQAPGDKDNKVTVVVDVNDGTTSPVTQFHKAGSSDTILLSTSRYTSDTREKIRWANQGTATRIQLIENNGRYTRVTISIQKSGEAPITILSNATIPTGNPYINLTRTFDTEEFNRSDKSFIYITFR